SAPYLAQLVKDVTMPADEKKATASDIATNAMGHALMGAVVAQLSGKDAVAGAVGAASGELTARLLIMQNLYSGRDTSDLTEAEKQSVSALASLAAGLASGIASGNTTGAATGAQAGRNAVENNFLNKGRPVAFAEKLKACNGEPSCEQGVRKDMAKESAENIQKLKSCWDAGDSACVAAMRSQIETDGKTYAQLGVQDALAGRSYENSANWYADIIDQCGGKCGWLESALTKTAADGLTDAVYGALGTGSLPKPGQTAEPASEIAGTRGVSEKGSVANANFAQSKIRANETFSAEGVAKYSQMAGQPVNNVDDLANAIRSGLIKPSQLSVDYVEMNGTKLILNTRTSVALDRAGIPKSDWYGTNQTNVNVPGMDGKTYNDLAADQLMRNKLPETGSSDIPRGRK
ncbi:VENN motif pre-toxin domain-containing protein, partial [Dickeya dianthicola]